MSDKTEITIDLEVSGAEGLCQTDDGYVWIGQFSGLTRYDSKEFVTFKEFEEDGVKHNIINVLSLETKDNVLFIQTNTNIFTYKNNVFHYVDFDFGIINDIDLSKARDILYISTKSGLYQYDTINDIVLDKDLETGKDYVIERGKEVIDCVVDENRNILFYQTKQGIYDEEGKLVYERPLDSEIFDLCAYNDTLLIGRNDGIIVRYDIKENKILDDSYIVGDQINKIIYSEKDRIIFVGTEAKGICSINEQTGTMEFASKLANKTQLVDLMIDYEGNLWVSSHNISASGVSIITKNSLVNLLYDDVTWQEKDANDKRVYAVEKIGNILYIASVSGLYLYDVNTKKLLDNSHIIEAVDQFAEEHNIANHDYRDVEQFNGKVYVAVNNVGLLEYDEATKQVVIYGTDYIGAHSTGLDESRKLYVSSIRSLRAFDNYLAMGYSRGIMKFDGTKFWVCSSINEKSVLYINKSNNGELLFDTTEGIYTINNSFTQVTEIGTIQEGRKSIGNGLKFLVDGNYVYYTLNSRLFKLDTLSKESTEVIIPYVKGSLVELSKVKVTSNDGTASYKYVIASQNQIYIVDSLENDHIKNYELYDASNGLEPIIANSSGFYDEAEQKYFFQSTAGIFVYDFKQSEREVIPVKIAVSSTELDGNKVYGNDITVGKYTYRVVFNLSVLGFKPNKGYSVFYKLDGVDSNYVETDDSTLTLSYTNIPGGSYTFHVYVVDENGQMSNEVVINLTKIRQTHEVFWFWVFISLVVLAIIGGLNFYILYSRDVKAEKREAELKGITIESIEAIARTIDVKDSYTNGHSIRVGYFSRVIAKELGMEGDELENLYYIALLHDIGKIGIPDAILNKPGRLTDEEFEIMKSHTTKGAKILADISTIPNIVEGAKYHHEKYGGGGYPEGLKGEDIPYIARIICCADCFDAMATRRVYKDPYPKEKIISEFERCKNIQFDPIIADVVIKLIKEGKLKTEDGKE